MVKREREHSPREGQLKSKVPKPTRDIGVQADADNANEVIHIILEDESTNGTNVMGRVLVTSAWAWEQTHMKSIARSVDDGGDYDLYGHGGVELRLDVDDSKEREIVKQICHHSDTRPVREVHTIKFLQCAYNREFCASRAMPSRWRFDENE